VIVAVGVFALLGRPAEARAQHCHMPSLVDAEGIGLRAGHTFVVAGYSTEQDAGDYEGLGLVLEWSRGWFETAASLTAYRIRRNGGVTRGLGDLQVAAGAVPFAREDGAARLGAYLGVSLPTGDDDAGLGMGHVMMMPALFGEARLGRLELSLHGGIGAAVGAGPDPHAHHHHGGAASPMPLVDPMNATELFGDLRVAHPIGPLWHVHLGTSAAAPLGDGEARIVLAAGGQLVLTRLDFGLELQVPVLGDPFTVRGVFSAGFRG